MSDAISAIEADIDAWVESEFSAERPPCVPDFWDELHTSETVAGYLATHGYVADLLAEVDRLRAENAELKADLDAAAAWIRDTFPDRKETTDV